jgi:hypothetical protein
MPRGGGRSNSRSSGNRSSGSGRSFFGNRSSGSGRSFFGSRSPPKAAPPRQNYQQSTARPQQPMAPQQTMPMQPQRGMMGGMMGGIGSTIVTGMALGAGSEVGHQAVR